MVIEKLHESEYGESRNNYHISRDQDVISVCVTYPPWTDADNKNDQVRCVEFDQEAVRASDGIRVHYDYDRDGYVVSQPVPYYVEHCGTLKYEEDWQEVGFFSPWALQPDDFDENPERYIRKLNEDGVDG